MTYPLTSTKNICVKILAICDIEGTLILFLAWSFSRKQEFFILGECLGCNHIDNMILKKNINLVLFNCVFIDFKKSKFIFARSNF